MRREATNGRELVLLAALLLFVAGLCLQPMAETDLFFRLKVGSELLARHALLSRNLFSFTAPDHPDLDLSWGFEVAVAFLYGLGGFPAVVTAKAIWMVGTFAGLFALCRRRGAGALSTAVVLAVAALVMRERLVERPHIVSFAGEVAVLAAIQGLPGPWSWRHRCIFVLGVIAWANLHAGVFAGVFLCLLAAGGFWRESRRLSGRALMLAGAAAGAAMVTPVGPAGLVRYLQLHLVLPRLHAVDEFRAATWRSDWPFFVFLAAVAAVVVAVLVAGWLSGAAMAPQARGGEEGVKLPVWSVPVYGDTLLAGRRDERLGPRLADLLPAAGMAALGVLTVRFSADATLVCAPVIALGFTTLRERLLPRWLRSRGGATAGTALVAMALLLLAVVPRLSEARAGGAAVDVDLDVTSLPLDALRFVEANGLRERMYNDFEIGSYLLFEGYPRYRVFVDPRLPAYPEEMHRLLGSFELDRAGWGAAMDRYGVESALLAYAGLNRRVAWWDPEEWALVFRASDSRVFVRRRERWRALIAAHEVPATFEFTVEQGAATLPLDRKPERSPVSDCEWQRRLGELVFELDQGRTGRAAGYFERSLAVAGCLTAHDEGATAAWLGALEMQPGQPMRAPRSAPTSAPQGAPAHALTHLDRALVLEPGDTRTRANRATVLERLGRRTEAAADWAAVGAQARGTPAGDAAAVRARNLVGSAD